MGRKAARNMQLHPAPGSKRSSQLHKMYQRRCKAKNSWWWAERLPETCRVVILIKLESSVSVGFIHKEYASDFTGMRINKGLSKMKILHRRNHQEPSAVVCFFLMSLCHSSQFVICISFVFLQLARLI
jgi:hypothetical protein